MTEGFWNGMSGGDRLYWQQEAKEGRVPGYDASDWVFLGTMLQTGRVSGKAVARNWKSHSNYTSAAIPGRVHVDPISSKYG